MTVLENHRKTWDKLHSEGYKGYTKDASGRAEIIKSMVSDCFYGGIVLEIGCGAGDIMREFAEEALQVWGADISREAISVARKNLEDVPNAFTTVNNGFDLDCFKDRFFDLVYSFWTFQHIPRKTALNYVKEAKRVLKNGGKLVFQVVSYDDYLMNAGDIGMLNGDSEQIGYTWKMLHKLVKEGEMIVRCIKTERWMKDRVFYWALCEK